MWGKRQDMLVHNESPFNAEPPASVLAAVQPTPNEAFFSRNHGSIQDIAPREWRLTVNGLVDTPMSLDYDQLTTGFASHTVAATLACAGNRRAELLAIRAIPGKEAWEHGAVSTAEWTGARLADVLEAAGVATGDGLHVAFAAPDVAPEARPAQPFGGSIPLGKAMSKEVLLAWQMNAEALPAVHGGPVRVVVPGYIGARSTKWVSEITVRDGPSDNYFQALDYRILPAQADPDTVSSAEGISMSILQVNCDVLTPTDGECVGAGSLTVRGYALVGDGHEIARVDVSLDGGQTWRQADLEPSHSPWTWRWWSTTVNVDPGPVRIVARAWDDAGTTQPEHAASLWNPRGYANNSWARVSLTAS
jgi:sulfite oxidase